MKAYPAFSLCAAEHKDLASVSKVFNVSELEYYLFVRIPNIMAKDFSLYQIDEVDNEIHFVCHKGLWEHDPNRIWYKFKFFMLNQEVGLHVYRMSFVNNHTNDTAQLYFGYVVQNNSPEKPYDYMHRGRLGVCGSCEKNTVRSDTI